MSDPYQNKPEGEIFGDDDEVGSEDQPIYDHFDLGPIKPPDPGPVFPHDPPIADSPSPLPCLIITQVVFLFLGTQIYPPFGIPVAIAICYFYLRIERPSWFRKP